MSTLTIPTQRTSDIDASFEVLARSARQAGSPDVGEDFGTVFDLDYGERALAAVAPPVSSTASPQSRIRVAPSPAARPVRPSPRAVRLTRRGRAVIVMAFLAVALVVMVALGGKAIGSLGGGHPEPVRIIEVQPGDTLYDIAGQVAKPGHIREMVLRIQQLNSLPGAQIEEGQELAVPAG